MIFKKNKEKDASIVKNTAEQYEEKIIRYRRLKKLFTALSGASLLVGWIFLLPSFIIGGSTLLSSLACTSFVISLGFNTVSSINGKKEKDFKDLLVSETVFNLDDETDFVQHDILAKGKELDNADEYEIPTPELAYEDKDTPDVDVDKESQTIDLDDTINSL